MAPKRRRLSAVPECWETATHQAHMELNGECPWCGATSQPDPELDSLTDDEAVAMVVKRHG